jgi:hypothetical protein
MLQLIIKIFSSKNKKMSTDNLENKKESASVCSQTFIVEGKPVKNSYRCNQARLSGLNLWKINKQRKMSSLRLFEIHVN